jgi:hypothetical protein
MVALQDISVSPGVDSKSSGFMKILQDFTDFFLQNTLEDRSTASTTTTTITDSSQPSGISDRHDLVMWEPGISVDLKESVVIVRWLCCFEDNIKTRLIGPPPFNLLELLPHAPCPICRDPTSHRVAGEEWVKEFLQR